MKKEIISLLNETLYSEKLTNGLNIYLLPKPEFSNVYAIFSTKFGSLKSQVDINGTIIPRGVAHFLEHRLFDNPKGEVFDMFSTLGSDVNAYTTFDRTVYYFSATKEIKANINLLLDFVQTCEMSEEAVENEKDIICEEMSMYADYPSTKLFQGILSNLYFNHEIKNEVIGDEGSVRSTDLRILKLAHQTFYHPSNMILVVCGRFDSEEMMKWIKENQKKKKFVKPLAYTEPTIYEPSKVRRKRKVINMPLNMKKVIVGFKIEPQTFTSPKEKNRKLIGYTIYLSMLFGKTSSYYQQLVKEKVIVADSFEFMHDLGNGYNFITVSADVYNEWAFIKIVREAISDSQICKDKNLFMQKKNANTGKSIRNLESPSDLALEFTSNKIDGMNVFDDISIIQSMTNKDIIKIGEEVRESDYSVFTIAKDKL